ncbi:DUF6146 family protein [uncultured Sunxiuqinia sp.]|uniref:DUF6146 family protein n=1 Tax=uncultured Sunxiuqinia sp. TaxID=1573825 RepID=UPI0030D6D50E|tara:strand:+ start:2799 stop:3200 length:402 start_codon:yes stop_codon:yes gene_type:complete
MKNILLILLLAVFAACSTPKNIQLKEVAENNDEDSVSYELIVLDPGFESWFITNSKPSWYHSQSYYETWNQQYVNAWNYHSIWRRNSQLLEGQINYEQNIDYGLEINHKLFYYFQYVERVLKIPIIENGPRVI